jgi:hypothetical protein
VAPVFTKNQIKLVNSRAGQRKMEFLIADVFFGLVGRIYLWVRYRNKEKVLEIKTREYAGSYSEAGKVKVVASGAIMLAVLILFLLCGVVLTVIKNLTSLA